MKRSKLVFYILMCLPLPVTLISLIFLWDQIAAHYGWDNEVTRWGSKYETLLLPGITFVFGLLLLGTAKHSARQEGTGKNNEKVGMITGIFALLVFNVMTGYFLYAAFNRVENLSDVPIDLNRLVFVFLGILLIVTGNIMPKVRKNSLMGLRTPWSMKNETTWKKSQRFGGISLMITGVLILLVCCVTEGFSCMAWSMGILIVSVPIDVYYTYRVARKD